MSNSDLTNLSLAELQALSARIHVETERREADARREALGKIKELADAAGINLSDLAREGRKTGRLPAKYVNPADSSQGWSGRGKKPRWVIELLEAGKTLQDLAVPS